MSERRHAGLGRPLLAESIGLVLVIFGLDVGDVAAGVVVPHSTEAAN